MENQDKSFNHRQKTAYDCVDEDRHSNDSPAKKCTMPSVGFICWIVENNQALNDGADEDASRC